MATEKSEYYSPQLRSPNPQPVQQLPTAPPTTTGPPSPAIVAYDPDPKATSMVVDENTADPINMIYFSQSGNASHQGSASVSMTGAASASTTR